MVYVKMVNTINTLCCPSKIVFDFSWGNCKSQEKLNTVLMQNFGGTTKSIITVFF